MAILSGSEFHSKCVPECACACVCVFACACIRFDHRAYIILSAVLMSVTSFSEFFLQFASYLIRHVTLFVA